MRATIRSGLVGALSAQLVDELLDAHAEAKRNFYLGGLRLSAVEGGRFCEAAFRILQQRVWQRFDPLNTQINTQRLITDLSQIAANAQPDSVRLHIPRALRVVYDIRNTRDNAHLADGIDPNLQDASLVIATIDWVLAEFVRLYHNVSASDAQSIVSSIVTRATPAVEDFDGFLKVLRTDLKVSDFMMLLLYQRGTLGATFDQLNSWARPDMRANLRRTLAILEQEKAYLHSSGGHYRITQTGLRYVESRRLMDPEAN